MSNGRLNVGIVGAAFAHSPDGRERFSVRAHIPALLKQSDTFNLAAVCTTKMSSASETCQRFGIPHAFDSVDRMLAELPDLDIVCVSVRPSVHHRVALPALKAGKHVYCELPMAVTTAQAQEMYELAKAGNLKSQVGYQHHFEPASLHMAELIQSGFIGKPLSFSHSFFSGAYIMPRPGHREWLFQAEDGGHPGYRSGQSLQRLMAVLGADVTDICAEMRVMVPERRNTDTDGLIKGNQVDNMNYLLRVGGDVIGTMQTSLTSWFGTGTRFEIYGTEGMLMLAAVETPKNWDKQKGDGDPTRGMLKLYGARASHEQLYGDPIAPERLQREFKEIEIPARHTAVSGFSHGQAAFEVAQAWSSFAKGIRGEKTSSPNFTDVIKIHYVLDAAERSVATGSWQKVDYSKL
ncbi:Gfo/Idh/MocA family protein [Microvirga alba]|uniref:Gfo/Idh/MocA family oxidoreductase n=1 Tax=Microvirga alba TaxID=2791025 RepID=A0A931FS95_9HYPH|nr:Gfo/Idh/MocA family oxidoreductase [Microvirga alba]MBF9235373.1 Gfo/Idh/MocA family oxidoreductase [Microvirga alba]